MSPSSSPASRPKLGGKTTGIPFYWRVELTATGIPVVYSYLLGTGLIGLKNLTSWTSLRSAVPE
jgi:hypothetical protein